MKSLRYIGWILDAFWEKNQTAVRRSGQTDLRLLCLRAMGAL